jgi:hypothetical protein
MYNSVEQINKTFREHLDSLRLSGLEYDRKAVLLEWANVLKEFRGESTNETAAEIAITLESEND